MASRGLHNSQPRTGKKDGQQTLRVVLRGDVYASAGVVVS